MNVLENFLPKSYQEELKDVFLAGNFPWYFQKKTNSYSGDYVKEFETPQFVHSLHLQNGHTSPLTSDFYKVLKPFWYYFEKALHFTPTCISRVKLNLLQRYSEQSIVHRPHTDYNLKEYYSLVYYVETSDGNTILYNKIADADNPSGSTYNGDKFLQRILEVRPIQGRLLMFTSNTYHSSSTPVQNDRRVVLNFIIKK